MDNLEFKLIDEQMTLAKRVTWFGQHLACKAWLDALVAAHKDPALVCSLDKPINEGRGQYTVVHRHKLSGVDPYIVVVVETPEDVTLSMFRDEQIVVELVIGPEGTFKELKGGVSTYFNVLAETYMQYVLDSNKTYMSQDDAEWLI